jgi:leucyl aminopeptidase
MGREVETVRKIRRIAPYGCGACQAALRSLAMSNDASIPIHLLYEDDLEEWRGRQDEATRNWLSINSFKAERCKLLLVPGPQGRHAAVLVGLGRRNAHDTFTWPIAASIPDRVPDGHYHLANELPSRAASQFAFGWAYGQYKFERYKRSATARSVQLRPPQGVDGSEVDRLRAATSLARDLINTPANDMSPETLAQAAIEVAKRYGARYRVVIGEDLLKERFTAIHAVGRAAAVAPRLVDIEWGDTSHPKVSLVGKGVCFDTGGLDIKPGASMLLMKKDMGGAAVAIATAQLIMDAKLPVRLRLILPIVENSISANAYRPGDVLGTRKGLTVEIGNTDAEGRVILCDALALADEDKPDLLIDTATLTGAARVALGPELPALFCTDDALAREIVDLAAAESDPVWRMPLWSAYDDELSSKIADVNNVSSSTFSGAIFGALFLQRFVTEARAWVHLDLYAWNGKERPGRPVGAEPQAVRALYTLIKHRYAR